MTKGAKTAGAGGSADPPPFDRELADLAPAQRRRIWMGRIEAALFASPVPIPPQHLARIVGEGVPLADLIEDIRAELTGRPYVLAQVPGGWVFRTRTEFAEAILAVKPSSERGLEFTEMEMAVLCAIAYHQPIDRAGLVAIFGKKVSRDLLSRLRLKSLIASGPRSPRTGAPHTFVTTDTFLETFDLQSLRDLPELLVSGVSPISEGL